MEKIIDPIDPGLIKKELTDERILCPKCRGGNILYVINAHNSPNTMRETGRLRELSFRPEGGCSGLSCDIDEFDTMEEPYQQLIVWNPEQEAILGGYRFYLCGKTSFDRNGQPVLASSHLFHFSETFLRDYLPHTMELGRAFVAPGYRGSKPGAKSIFVLDNLFTGLANLVLKNPEIKHYFGKVTFHPTYDACARDMIYRFLEKYFSTSEDLVSVRHPQPFSCCQADGLFNGKDREEDYRKLKALLKERGTQIPPMLNTYMNLSDSMNFFGAAVNDTFGNASECALLISFDEIKEARRLHFLGNHN